ncbi:MAG TPA: Ig-like domain-containing protein, partial [Solirubrobacteraceae bacterium]|nr:Ig-like domain-containing protein [Solirubrobacteraceae bacterium]
VLEVEPPPPPPPDPIPPDATPPSVALTAPAAGSTLAATATVAADAADASGVAKVEFLAGDRVIGTDAAAPFAIDWDTATVADGSHSLTARATDAAGNTATSEALAVTVANAPPPPPETPQDTTPPQTAIDAGPAHTQRTGAARFDFRADETATFECRLDGGAFAACAPSDLLHVANGAHAFEVRARDAAGNVDPTPARREWWADALLQNGTFEAATAGWAEQGIPVPGWNGYRSTVRIVAGGVAGAKARVEPLAGERYYGLYDAPRSVDATVAGRTYTAGGRVRSDRGGDEVCLEVIERSDSAVVGSGYRCVTATGSWQAFPEVAYAARAAGNDLYVSIAQDGAADGDSFEVDGLTLDDGTPATAGPPAPPEGDPVLWAFGDVASCGSSGDEAMARLMDTRGGTIAMVGDTEQNNGSAAEFAGCFQPTWDRHMPRIRPTVGDHEYRQPGAVPYWDTFGARAGERGKGWYSYDLGAWHVVVLNSNCGQVGGCGAGSEQHAWLERDLAANAKACIGAYFHHPRFSAGSVHGSQEHVKPFWDVLYRYSAEFVLGGNDHNYQRFAQQTPDGQADPGRGIRQFVVGTGGTMHYPLGTPLPTTEVQHSGAFGALKLTLGTGSYQWQFVPQEGMSFTDAGTQACSPVPQPDTTPPAVALTEPQEGATLTGTARVAATATDDGVVDRVDFRAGDRVLATDTTAPYAADVDLGALSPGQYALTAVARDRAGNAATSAPVTVTVAAPPAPPNLVANPGFESGLSGWSGYRATLTRVTGGVEGQYAARASYSTTGSSYSMISTPVTATPAGTAYRATAWVRSVTPGRRVCLRLRETGTGGALGAAETCATATGSWQAFPAANYRSVGGGKLDLYAYQEAPVAGDSFDLDDVRLTG